MASNTLELMVEAERRGILPPDKVALLAEARKRGLVEAAVVPQPSTPGGDMFAKGTLGSIAASQPVVSKAVRAVPHIPAAVVSGAAALFADMTGNADQRKGADIVRRSIPKELQTAADIEGALVPMGLGAARGLMRAERLLPAMGSSAVEGAVASQLPYQKPEDRMTSALVGGAVPPAIVGVTKAFPAARNVVARLFNESHDPATETMRREAAFAVADDYNAAQATGNKRINQVTREAAGGLKSTKFARDQLNERMANIQRVADSLGGDQALATDASKAKAFQTAARDQIRAAEKVRGERYKGDFEILENSAEGKALRIPSSDLLARLQNVEDDFSNVFAMARKGDLGGKLKDSIAALEARAEAGKAVDLAGYRNLVEGINSARTYGSSVAPESRGQLNAFLSRVRSEVDGAVDALPENAAGAAKLRAINSEYAERSEGLRVMKADATNRLFGSTKALADPTAKLDAFLGLNPDAQRQGVTFLQEQNPALLDELRRRYLQNLVKGSVDPSKPSMQSVLDPQILAKRLANPKVLESPIFTAEQKKFLRSSAADLRVVLGSVQDALEPGTKPNLTDLTATLSGMHRVFVSRFIARAYTSAGLEDLLFSTEGRAALGTLANLRTSSNAAKQNAIAYLSAWSVSQNEAEPSAE